MWNKIKQWFNCFFSKNNEIDWSFFDQFNINQTDHFKQIIKDIHSNATTLGVVYDKRMGTTTAIILGALYQCYKLKKDVCIVCPTYSQCKFTFNILEKYIKNINSKNVVAISPQRFKVVILNNSISIRLPSKENFMGVRYDLVIFDCIGNFPEWILEEICYRTKKVRNFINED